MSRGGVGQEANPRVTGVTVCGEDSDEEELFYSTLSRNKGEGRNDKTKGPRFACPKICVIAAEKSAPTEALKRSIPCETH